MKTSIIEIEQVVQELEHFLIEYGKIRGLDPENVYSLHVGDPERESHLKISTLSRLAEFVKGRVNCAEVGHE